MKKLLKSYGFNSDMQYFEMIADSFLNGQYSQARQQFKALPKADKKNMIKSIMSGNWQTTIDHKQLDILFNEL